MPGSRVVLEVPLNRIVVVRLLPVGRGTPTVVVELLFSKIVPTLMLTVEDAVPIPGGVVVKVPSALVAELPTSFRVIPSDIQQRAEFPLIVHGSMETVRLEKVNTEGKYGGTLASTLMTIS